MSDTANETDSERSATLAPEHQELLDRVRARRVLPMAAERRSIREAAGVSQHEMARALGVSWTAIYRWERGSRPREREHEIAYADLLIELKRASRTE